ncbi:hypothetical protein [Pontixanthobacter sp. CEM42]|uniref:hypothetical protein n=1 Tax=Pontixanthobacter sp. CEM42 TaxID=2792077 RepID=UPI001ADFD2B2|nr:hypothetical protein [Pontixanthobacter sp. CEM42]
MKHQGRGGNPLVVAAGAFTNWVPSENGRVPVSITGTVELGDPEPFPVWVEWQSIRGSNCYIQALQDGAPSATLTAIVDSAAN